VGVLKIQEQSAQIDPEQCLSGSWYCDLEHPAIVRASAEIGAGSEDPTGTAVRMFEFVRDQIVYAFGSWSMPASQTLEAGRGMCTTKTNLLVALLRAAGIPAAYGVMRVDASRFFGSLVPAGIKTGGENSVHIYGAAWLNDRWVSCDPSTDAALATATALFADTTELVRWDGKNDAMTPIVAEHIHADLGISPQIDAEMDKSPDFGTDEILKLPNSYLEFVRRSPGACSGRELYEAWIRRLDDPAMQATLRSLIDEDSASELLGRMPGQNDSGSGD